MLTLAPSHRIRPRSRADKPPILDVIDLAVMRFRQDPGGFDSAMLFRELDRDHRVELVGRIIAERPKGWARGTGRAGKAWSRRATPRVTCM